MQTVQLEIEDNQLDIFLNIVKNLKDGIVNNFTIWDTYSGDLSYKNNKEYFHKLLDQIEHNDDLLIPFEKDLEELDGFIDRVNNENC